MEEIVNKFIEEGKQEHEEIEAFIREFRTTNDLLLKERNNSLSELEFEVYGLSRAINKAQIVGCEAKGVTTRGGKSTTDTICDINNTDKHLLPHHDEPTTPTYPSSIREEIVEEVLIKIDKFVLPIDFVILDMREDSRIPIILGRPFIATARAMIDVFNKKITLRVGSEEVIFDVDKSMKRPLTKDNECYRIDDLDTVIQTVAQEILENDQLNNKLEEGIHQPDFEKSGDGSDSEAPIRRIE
ncbi:reverse transcriptase domain-containing protein [Tanacetum coccineum]